MLDSEWQKLAGQCLFTAAAVQCSTSESERKANADVGVAFVDFSFISS